MSTALLFVLIAFSIAFLMFAALAWKIAPIVFLLMRAQVTYDRRFSDLLHQVEDISDRVPEVSSEEINRIKERIARLEKKTTTVKAPTRRRKVTA